ncbi:KH domain-containing protein [uncultured Thermosynechococcus sp.]|uniref:KH domain-containing protein n=1 Tax=uncultured Thermosynechococcus sp. TaxID=436945 RepID=UPI00260204E6|nr:KH domain-containing protein [uncultured Thermosynechococcus sp.]
MTESAAPNYAALIRFLLEPFMEAPETLRLHAEFSPANSRIWVRLAFAGEDKGRVYGRGGRNLHAVRAVLQAAAQAAGQQVYLDVYDDAKSTPKIDHQGGDRPRRSRRRSYPSSRRQS